MEFSSQIGLVEHGVSIALVPRLGREALPEEIVAVPLSDPAPTRRVMLTWRRSMSSSAAVATVRDALATASSQRLRPELDPPCL